MNNLSISPSKLEIQLKPGTNYVQSYIIKNIGDQQLTLNSSIDSWIPQGSDGNVTYLNTNPNISLSLSNTDLKLGQNFVLGPNQTKQLVLKIQATTLGDHYFTLFINQDTSAIASSNSTQLIRLGSHLLISVSDTDQPPSKLVVNNFKVNNPFIDSFFFPTTFSGQIINQSNYFDKVNKSIVITKNGQEVTKLTIFPDNVLANHSRNLRCLDNNLPVNCQLSKPVLPGFYQATIDKQTVSFVVLPYSLLIFSAIIFIIIKAIIDNYKHPKL